MSTTNATPMIDWPGASGHKYRYRIYPIGQTFKAIPGNYIFAKETESHRWRPVYIGETSDLSERFNNHHKMTCIQRNGATHIMVHSNDAGVAARRREEADLLANHSPTCNE